MFRLNSLDNELKSYEEGIKELVKKKSTGESTQGFSNVSDAARDELAAVVRDTSNLHNLPSNHNLLAKKNLTSPTSHTGLDCEWTTLSNNLPSKIKLIQITSSENLGTILIPLDKIVPPQALIDYLKDGKIKKAGVAVKSDLDKLRSDYPKYFSGRNTPKGYYDIGLCLGRHQRGEERFWMQASLKKCYEWGGGVEMEKSKRIQKSNWGREVLSETQIKYASLDSVAGCFGYGVLKEKCLVLGGDNNKEQEEYVESVFMEVVSEGVGGGGNVGRVFFFMEEGEEGEKIFKKVLRRKEIVGISINKVLERVGNKHEAVKQACGMANFGQVAVDDVFRDYIDFDLEELNEEHVGMVKDTSEHLKSTNSREHRNYEITELGDWSSTLNVRTLKVSGEDSTFNTAPSTSFPHSVQINLSNGMSVTGHGSNKKQALNSASTPILEALLRTRGVLHSIYFGTLYENLSDSITPSGFKKRSTNSRSKDPQHLSSLLLTSYPLKIQELIKKYKIKRYAYDYGGCAEVIEEIEGEGWRLDAGYFKYAAGNLGGPGNLTAGDLAVKCTKIEVRDPLEGFEEERGDFPRKNPRKVDLDIVDPPEVVDPPRDPQIEGGCNKKWLNVKSQSEGKVENIYEFYESIKPEPTATPTPTPPPATKKIKKKKKKVLNYRSSRM
ncbi:hypothetical protein TL16_g01184 [Triparma laevis f. inornata]|uniref:3'-5' exonuclease domain-containing protein n=1 Tax=Triparma laevis f. inornata TaxID=1714386 RepID=A0A9W7DQA6_9STRA|nr:hypothetical protein TL16_g01184 [Triparma laevis f. inornata]